MTLAIPSLLNSNPSINASAMDSPFVISTAKSSHYPMRRFSKCKVPTEAFGGTNRRRFAFQWRIDARSVVGGWHTSPKYLYARDCVRKIPLSTVDLRLTYQLVAGMKHLSIPLMDPVEISGLLPAHVPRTVVDGMTAAIPRPVLQHVLYPAILLMQTGLRT